MTRIDFKTPLAPGAHYVGSSGWQGRTGAWHPFSLQHELAPDNACQERLHALALECGTSIAGYFMQPHRVKTDQQALLSRPCPEWAIAVTDENSRSLAKVISTQTALAYAAVPYPLSEAGFDELTRISREHKCIFWDAGFMGWEDERRVAVIDQMRLAGLRVLYKWNGQWGGRMASAEWALKAVNWTCALVVPGLGYNTWRMSEMLALGVPVIAHERCAAECEAWIEPAMDGVHFVTARDDDFVGAFRRLTANDGALAKRVSENAKAYAAKHIRLDGWLDTIAAFIAEHGDTA